ncbi:lysophospholipid acyltransferase family protein [Herpetosiphon llansteffanensis]|uniref:lysophospholipid acyltransferase family protein n=1 Tax=Herpetosiphon llansteffanensis TaxID=2094568 RepID=UPI000D7C183A|nr:lysophospholipid acyltransferase family protein [Herpetosiphon llansteffanensis]
MYQLLAQLTTNPQRLARVRRIGRWLPQRLVIGLSWMLAVGLYLVVPRLRRHLQANVVHVLLDGSWLWRTGVCVRYLQHLLLLLYEVLIGIERLNCEHVLLEGTEHIEAALAQGRGVILYTPHQGNFFYSYWRLAQRYNCLTVGTAGSPELRPLYEQFHQLGCAGFDYDATSPRELIRGLRQHLQANGVVFLLGDFWRPNFPEASFFGLQSRTPQGAATFALEDNVPIVPCYSLREGKRHRLICQAPVHLGRSFGRKQRREATDELNEWMASIISENPSQWLYWFNCQERWEGDDQRLPEQSVGQALAA